MTRLDAPTEPKPEGRKRKYRSGVLWGLRHRFKKERDGHRAACGLTVNVAQPDWSGEGEECPRCYQEEVEGE